MKENKKAGEGMRIKYCPEVSTKLKIKLLLLKT